MPVTPGDFSASTLGKIQVEMDKIFANNQLDVHLNKSVDWFKAVAENQQFSIDTSARAFVDGYDDRAYIGTWLQMCDMTVVENSTYAGNATDCAIDGDEVGSLSKSYTPNLGFHKEFKVVNDANHHNNQFSREQKIARGMATTIAALELELENKLIATLDGAADTLVLGDLEVGALADSSTTWNITGNDWTIELIMTFLLYAKQKKFMSPKLLNGSNFWREMNLAKFNADPNKTYEALFNGVLPMAWNIDTVDTTLNDKKSFLIDNANIAFFNTQKFTNTTPFNRGDGDNTHTFSVRSNRLRWKDGSTMKPVMFDVKRQYKCVGNDQWADVFRVEFNGGLVFGPEACSGTYNHVVRIARDCANCLV